MLLLCNIANDSRFQIGMVQARDEAIFILIIFGKHLWWLLLSIYFHGDHVGLQGDFNVAVYSLLCLHVVPPNGVFVNEAGNFQAASKHELVSAT